MIADIMLNEVFGRATEKGIKIDVTERFKVGLVVTSCCEETIRCTDHQHLNAPAWPGRSMLCSVEAIQKAFQKAVNQAIGCSSQPSLQLCSADFPWARALGLWPCTSLFVKAFVFQAAYTLCKACRVRCVLRTSTFSVSAIEARSWPMLDLHLGHLSTSQRSSPQAGFMLCIVTSSQPCLTWLSI